MENQKQAVLKLVETHRSQGRSVGEVLSSVGVARHNGYELTVEERQMIEEVKQSHAEYRHRRIEGVLQQRGVYLSALAIYPELLAPGQWY